MMMNSGRASSSCVVRMFQVYWASSLSSGMSRKIASAAAGTALTAFLANSLFWFTIRAFERGQTSPASDTALWIPQSLLVAGAAMLALQMAARLAQAILGLQLEDPRLQVSALSE